MVKLFAGHLLVGLEHALGAAQLHVNAACSPRAARWRSGSRFPSGCTHRRSRRARPRADAARPPAWPSAPRCGRSSCGVTGHLHQVAQLVLRPDGARLAEASFRTEDRSPPRRRSCGRSTSTSPFVGSMVARTLAVLPKFFLYAEISADSMAEKSTSLLMRRSLLSSIERAEQLAGVDAAVCHGNFLPIHSEPPRVTPRADVVLRIATRQIRSAGAQRPHPFAESASRPSPV